MAFAARAEQTRFFYAPRKGKSKTARLKIAGRMALYFFMPIALIAVPIAFYALTIKNPYFDIVSVEVSGVTRPSVNKVLGDIEPLLSGNIFTADIKSATQNLKKNPWVAFGSIRRKLPGTLAISVTERYPVAVAQLEKPYLVDWQGYLLEETDKNNERVLIVGFSENAAPDGRISDPRLADAYKIIDIFSRDTVFNDPVTFVDISDPEMITARTEKTGTLIRFGPDKDEWGEKFLEYLTVRKILSDKGTEFRTVDLSFDDQVVVTRGGKEFKKDQIKTKEGVR